MFTDHDPPIRYWAEAGTVLGAVRHGGLVPWDDDVDFGMWKADMARHLRGEQWHALLAYYDLGMYLTPDWRCKIYPATGSPVHGWRFPTADVYAFEYRGGEERLRYGGPEWQQVAWGDVAPTVRQVESLRTLPFGAGRVRVFEDARTYLDRRYGPSWPVEAVSNRMDHLAFTPKRTRRWTLRPEDLRPAQPMPDTALPPHRVRREGR